jgi:protein SCO1/2
MGESREYVHSAGIMVATERGILSHYFLGVMYSAKDVRLGLVDSSEGKIGNLVDQVFLFCFRYDSLQGKYTPVILNIGKVVGIGTVLILATVIITLRVSEIRKRRHG